jgi:hypothetical protein
VPKINARWVYPETKRVPSQRRPVPQACQAIHEAMKQDVPMTEAEQLKLENNVVLIQMGYLEWKRWNRSAKVDLLRREARTAA